jgi:N-acetylmuramoyl-L-alanine amidase
VGIWVLQATAMPSVLIETGFISNPEEERYLNSQAGQTELSECIVKALKKYQQWLNEKADDVEKKEKNDTNKAVKLYTQNQVADTKAFLEFVQRKENQHFH